MSLVTWLWGGSSRQARNKQTRRRQAMRHSFRERRLRLESLEARALMATLTWDGNNGNGKNTVWTAWSNWSPDRVPQNGDALVFSGSRKLANYNNTGWGTSYSQLTITSNGFNIDGNAITLGSGGIHFTGGNTATLGLPVALPNAATPLNVTGSRVLYLTDTFLGAGGLTKQGSGTAVMGAAGSFTGTTTIIDGRLQLNHGSALQSSTLDYNHQGGSISFNTGGSAALGGLAGAQNLALVNAAGGALALTVGGNGQDTIYAGVLSGAGELIKVGNAALTLAGAHTYTGNTTIQSGSLLVNGALTSSRVLLDAGTLAGSGSVGYLETRGGMVAPGQGAGTLTITSGASLARGTLQFELLDADHVDRLLVTGGDVVLGGELELRVGDNFTPAVDHVFAVVNNAGTGATAGEFAGVEDGQSVLLNGRAFRIRYRYDFDNDGQANDVVLVPGVSIPTAVADEFTLDEDTTLVIAAPELLKNDVDPAGRPLTVSTTLVQAPSHGTVTVTPDGGLVYKPAANFHGVDDTMIYEVSNEQGGIAQASVTFRVQAVNDQPDVSASSYRTTTGTTVKGQLKASDVDGQPLTFSLVTTPASGRLTMNANGSFTYVPGVVSQNTDVTFAYAVSDGEMTVDATATIGVQPWRGNGIRPDVLLWILRNNPGLRANFLTTELPDRQILIPNGTTVPIYKLDQFLDVNFRFDFVARKREGVNIVQTQEWQLRKLLALPEFYDAVKSHAHSYRIAGLGQVSSARAYDYLRDINRRIMVGANHSVKAPVGGGNGIMAPSWAVWKQMNIFWHEACHVIGIGHNSGGLSGPIAGRLRDWDRQERWNYQTIDLNQLEVPGE